MNRKYSILFLLFCSFLLNAQDKKPNSWGLEAVTTFTKWYWSPIGNELPGQQLELPVVKYRQGFGLSLRKRLPLTQSINFNVNLGWNQNKTALKTNGPLLVLINNQPTYIQLDYIDYRFQQIYLLPTLSYSLFKGLEAEGGIYISHAYESMEYKLGTFADWANSSGFQQNWDYGLSGGLTFSIHSFYLRTAFQYGLKNQEEFSITDANGLSLGKSSLHYHNLTAGLGYYF
ncbi:MAG: hypothetical protein IPH36_02670 [Saprospiraceae bacterium]|nr:hypothetical protein [Saprospiraceae bacterium]MBK7789981.1 hypothetical protein [Saprospiraceae bacterium]MBK8110205.1 hypothetical protein [Saprospiraceae bacterium]